MPPMFSYSNFSVASLEDVVSVQTFCPGDYCNGLLIKYQNGTQHTVGQCRLGVDAVHTYEAPTQFYYNKGFCPDDGEMMLHKVGITFATSGNEAEQSPRLPIDDDWINGQMKGNLLFWCTHNQADIDFR
jgi:hypothetical protein